MPNPLAERSLDAAGERLNAGDFAGAAPLVASALAVDPRNVRGLTFRALVAAEAGQREGALEAIRQALRLAPQVPAVINNAALVYLRCGETEKAVEMWRRVVETTPQAVDASYNLGLHYVQRGDLTSAETYYRVVMRHAPGHKYVYQNLGNVLKDGGRVREAIEVFREGVRRHPAELREYNNLLYATHFDPGCGSEDAFREHAAWGRLFEASFPLSGSFQNDRSAGRRLRVGYVSPNFRDHCQSLFTVPLLSRHDRSVVEVYCYSDTTATDRVTDRVRGYADVWREIGGKTDAEVAEMVRCDRVDVLVDLTMHMDGSRLGLFARKAAPVQVAWLAYPGTTGLSRMDYRLTDGVLDPPGEGDGLYTERSVRMETFWCYDPLTADPAVGPLPADANGYATFGCLNNFAKVSPGVLEAWGRILAAVPEARLIVLAPADMSRERLSKVLQADPRRVECVRRQSRDKYLALYNRIDLALDPFPYTGHTTTLDGLWMGVPVVTLRGATVASRGSLSALSNLGLRELAAETVEEYVALATGLARDPGRLRQLREDLRGRMERSVLMDAGRFARGVEDAYRAMWREWCATA